jgi:hypothetical protein
MDKDKGFGKGRRKAKELPPPERDHLCAYTDGLRRCPLSGTMTSTTSPRPDTRWYCRHHFEHLDDPATCQRILDELERLPQPKRQDWREEATGAWLEAHAHDPLVKRAHLLAAGLGSIEDKRDHLQDLMKLANRIATPLPYDPRSRLSRSNGGAESTGQARMEEETLSTETVDSFAAEVG